MTRSQLRALFRGLVAASVPFTLGADMSATVDGGAADGGAADGGAADGGPRDGALADAAAADLAEARGPSLPAATCLKLCGTAVVWCQLESTDGGLPQARCVYAPDMATYSGPTRPPTRTACGRRPENLPDWRAPTPDPVAAYLAEAAYLEAASVDAFAIMARELAAHGAPTALRRAARRAAKDEVRHARTMGALARRRGAVPVTPQAPATPVRSLERMALENAVEGCVRESYGALLATYQAQTAADGELRAALGRIAEEETAHAALSWALDAWLQGQLDEPARARVRAARSTAAAALLAELRVEPDAALIAEAGLPPAPIAEGLAAHLLSALQAA